MVVVEALSGETEVMVASCDFEGLSVSCAVLGLVIAESVVSFCGEPLTWPSAELVDLVIVTSGS